jgi:hypothetical protein
MLALIIIIIIVALWCWNFLWNHPKFKIRKWQDIESRCKSGDIILFHGLDNYAPLFIGCYYGHIGIVYRENQESPPYIFEAWNPTNEKFYPSEFNHGMAFSELRHRALSYRGYIFYKELQHRIPHYTNVQFYQFIYWAMGALKYNPSVVRNGIRKFIFNDDLRIGTNCGELVYMSLINIGLLNFTKLKENRKHHLKWLCGLEHTDDGNRYLEPVYIWQEYFTTCIDPIATDAL